MALAGLILLLLTCLRLSQSVWNREEQGHGPLILAASAWLLWRARHELSALPSPRRWGFKSIAGGLWEKNVRLSFLLSTRPARLAERIASAVAPPARPAHPAEGLVILHTRDAPPRVRYALEPAGIHPLLAQLLAARGVRSGEEMDDGLARLLPAETLRGAA